MPDKDRDSILLTTNTRPAAALLQKDGETTCGRTFSVVRDPTALFTNRFASSLLCSRQFCFADRDADTM